MRIKACKLAVAGALFFLPCARVQPAAAPPSHDFGSCAVFPTNNIWNTPVDTLPVDANSNLYVATIGTTKFLHPDFSAAGGGIPFVTVPGTQPKVPIVMSSPEVDPGPYPVPPDAPVEIGSDAHVLVVDRDNCILYELYAAAVQPDHSWTADSGAVFDLKCNALRPMWWTSADAAGLPILAGLVRYEEVQSGEIRHAIRLTVPQTRNSWVWPGRHRASSLTDVKYPPMGQRFRMKANYDISGFAPEVQVVLRALKKYGMILADNGSAWYITGVPDSRWDDDAFHAMHNILGSAFEAVDVSSLMISEDSAAARPPQ